MPKIAIIGAGPAGLSLARLLNENELHDITVFERSARVGGKVESVEVDGRYHELGACYLTSGYTRLTPWMKEDGHTFTVLETFEMDDGKSLQDFIYGDSRIRAQLHIAKYLASWVSFHVREALGLVSDSEYARLAKPFGPWLREGGMESMHRLARRSTVAMGYGFLDQSPRLYGYRWNKPSLIYTGLRKNTREPDLGWSNFWERLGRRYDLRLEHEVTDLRREGGQVVVEVDRPGADGQTETVTLPFDHVVVAVPLTLLARFTGATDDEKWYADKLVSNRYATSLVEVDGWFDEPVDTYAYRERLLPPAQRENPDEPWDRPLVARRTPRKGGGNRPIYVAYQYVDPQHDPKTNPEATDASLDERLAAQLRADLALEGAELKEVIEQRVWDYFPRLSAEGIAAGGVNRLERMQGIDGVWYSGGSVVLESIDHIVDYNTVLAMRMAHAING
ncbi:MAG: hypothetical protein ACI9K2_003692, partial [Myxococcota bacterium]